MQYTVAAELYSVPSIAHDILELVKQKLLDCKFQAHACCMKKGNKSSDSIGCCTTPNAQVFNCPTGTLRYQVAKMRAFEELVVTGLPKIYIKSLKNIQEDISSKSMRYQIIIIII